MDNSTNIEITCVALSNAFDAQQSIETKLAHVNKKIDNMILETKMTNNNNDEDRLIQQVREWTNILKTITNSIF